ncbi:1-acyl-sn-glycerol-3-phosphate acyltransferase [Alphaproteobacteria bacterium]|nr:1-acyl-sn-glycerol-3-phosphate acyltransferase [Alphaproteobacteria bacterium]
MLNIVRVTVRLFVFLAFTFVLAPWQILFVFIPPIRHIIPLIYHRTLLKLLGVRVRVSGAEPEVGALFVCNHLSWFDIVVIGSLLPVSFVAKKEIRSWPLFGLLAQLQRTVFVDRRPGRHTVKTSNQLSRRLAAQERLVLFPEGTSTDGMRVLPFKSSLFASVERQENVSIKVQPMSMAFSEVHNIAMGRRQRLAYAWVGDVAFLPHLLFIFGTPPLTIDIVFHPPLAAEDMVDRKAMARASEQAVREGVDQIFSRRLAV